MKTKYLFLLAYSLIMVSCGKSSRQADLIPISEKALYDTTSLYYADFFNYPDQRRSLPIGIFDSGTGGLTVLEKFLVCDGYDNITGKPVPDGIPDFAGEHFKYLADNANMPYGNYAAENKSDFLRELVVKDALFLMNDENPVKIVVIACNTATAYGLNDIDRMLSLSGTDIKVIGVIQAGVKALYEGLLKDRDYAFGVMATPGTISSNAYERTIRDMADSLGYTGEITVINQSGKGFAEAVDGEKDYAHRDNIAIRSSYRGPGLGLGEDDIKMELLPAYNFDYSSNNILLRSSEGQIMDIQLNSAGNYARFHLVSMMEKYRMTGLRTPIRRVVLGCTHYPYLLDTLHKVVEELRVYKNEGIYPYSDLLASDIEFIDPALNTAMECYAVLRESGDLALRPAKNRLFPFISIPRNGTLLQYLNEDGSFTYQYKYGRDSGTEEVYTDIVPFSRDNIDEATLLRLEKLVPHSWLLIKSTLKN